VRASPGPEMPFGILGRSVLSTKDRASFEGLLFVVMRFVP
jgi:hypothetical protein